MGFSNQERININSAALQATTLDANPSSVWYEKKFNFQFALPAKRVWTEFDSIPIAANLATARTNATNNPTIIVDLSQNADAVRLTKVSGTNNSTFAAYTIYNDFSTEVLGNWIQPQQISTAAGQPSAGYTVLLYNGDPAGAGVLIGTSAGTTGTGSSKTVGWIWNYSVGLLLLSEDFYTETGITSASFDPYVLGFRYIGATASSGGSRAFVADETITAGQIVRLVTDADVGLTPGRVILSIANSVSNSVVFGIAQTGGVQGNTIYVSNRGSSDLVFAAPPAATDMGKTIYLSATSSGVPVLTAPTGSTTGVVEIGNLLYADGVLTKVEIELDSQFIIFNG